MNPNSGEAPKFELPSIPPSGHELADTPKHETAPVQENAVGKRAPSTSVQAVNPPVAVQIPSSVPVPSSYQNTPAKDDKSSGLTAAEIDRIEKEWIDKAKSIVAKTSDDPREQNSEMSKVKADYIKKRFNKTIPTDDTVAA